jgi:hypothetical protein
MTGQKLAHAYLVCRHGDPASFGKAPSEEAAWALVEADKAVSPGKFRYFVLTVTEVVKN